MVAQHSAVDQGAPPALTRKAGKSGRIGGLAWQAVVKTTVPACLGVIELPDQAGSWGQRAGRRTGQAQYLNVVGQRLRNLRRISVVSSVFLAPHFARHTLSGK